MATAFVSFYPQTVVVRPDPADVAASVTRLFLGDREDVVVLPLHHILRAKFNTPVIFIVVKFVDFVTQGPQIAMKAASQ